MDTIKRRIGAHGTLSAAIERGMSRDRMLALSLLIGASAAFATPPPPPKPALLREARMTVSVRLIEAGNRLVSRITQLCEVSGKIPVYSDNGTAALVYGRDISGCTMSRNGKTLTVSVRGAQAVSKDAITYATAVVSVTPPDAVALCDMCGPQPLADSRGEIRVSGSPESMTFSLHANPVSILNAQPSVWLEADVQINDGRRALRR